MSTLRAALFAILVVASACQQPMNRPSPDALPQTVPEATGYLRTSSHAEVLSFLEAIAAVGDPRIWRTDYAATPEGRAQPLLVVADPPVTSPSEAHRSGKPIVFVQANIHAGEVEGKEACLELLRAVVAGDAPYPVEDVVWMVVPIYNADGNDRFGPENRPHQHGPDEMGVRTTASGLDLNRDYMKLENQESRDLIALLNAWDPHVHVDLHTTNGSAHGYELTYAPPLSPSAHPELLRTLEHDWLPTLRMRMRERHGFETFDYGNFLTEEGDFQDAPSRISGWQTFDHRPRFGNNYMGLRNRLAILSEAYSCIDFETRIAATKAFVTEILRLAAERGSAVDGLCRQFDSETVQEARRGGLDQATGAEVVDRGGAEPVLLRPVRDIENPRTGAPVREAYGERSTLEIPCRVKFAATGTRPVPAGYLLPATHASVAEHLALHGIEVRQLDAAEEFDVEVHRIQATEKDERAFQGHHQRHADWDVQRERRTFPKGSWHVSCAQPLARLVFHLIDPQADDGLVVWNFFSDTFEQGVGAELPVYAIR